METQALKTQPDPSSAFLDEKAFKSRTVLIFATITDATPRRRDRRRSRWRAQVQSHSIARRQDRHFPNDGR